MEIMLALSNNTRLAWIDKKTGGYPEYIRPKERVTQQLLDWFDKNLKKDKFYTIEYYWKDAIDGHIMLMFKRDGNAMLYDPQSNDVYADKLLELAMNSVKRNSIKLMNISDCFLNKNVVESILVGQNDRDE